MRKIGIIGGTSWSSTALYYEHINRTVAKRLGGLHSAELVIESLDLAPVAAMELSGDWDGVARVTLDAAKRLVAAGAQGVIITSNTGHKVYEAVAANIPVPMLHIAEATADRLADDGRTRVALLGTRFTMTEPHVRSRLEARGITLAPVAPAWIAEVDRIIFDELAAGRVVRDSQRKLKSLIHRACQAEGPGDRAWLHRAGACGRRAHQYRSRVRHDRDPCSRSGRLDAGRAGRGARRRLVPVRHCERSEAIQPDCRVACGSSQ